jgi:hypothetical protein
MSAQELERMQRIQQGRDVEARRRLTAAFLLLLSSAPMGRHTPSHEAAHAEDADGYPAHEPNARRTVDSSELP